MPYIKANEPGTRTYLAWQREDDPTRFGFEAAYRSELVGGDVVFTDYNLIATNQE